MPELPKALNFEEFINELYWQKERHSAYKGGAVLEKPNPLRLATKEDARKELEKLTVMMQALDVDLALFKSQVTGAYMITSDVDVWFSEILGSFEDVEYSNMRTQKFEHVPPGELTHLRMLLYDALRSLNVEKDVLEQQIGRFNARTSCPPYFQWREIDPLVGKASCAIIRVLAPSEDALQYHFMSDAQLPVPMAAQDWASLVDAMQDEYLDRIAPEFIARWKKVAVEYAKRRKIADEALFSALSSNPSACRYGAYEQTCRERLSQSEERQKLETRIATSKGQKKRKYIEATNALERELEQLTERIRAMCWEECAVTAEDKQVYDEIYRTQYISGDDLLKQILSPE